MSQQVISIEVENKPGILTKISALFSRRGFSIVSLSVGTTHKEGISRFTIVTEGNEETMEQIRKQSQKLINVLKTDRHNKIDSILREFTILKLEINDNNRSEVNHIIDFFGGRLLSLKRDNVIVEFSGSDDKINSIFSELKNVRIIESIRTGKVGMKT